MVQPSSPTGPGGAADAYLAVVGKKQGAVKGECRTPGHENEITLLTWQWGLSAPTAVGTTAATGRRVHEALTVTKHLDSASTPLYNALATNEPLKSVKLSLRKAGLEKDDFFTIELERARVIKAHLDADATGQVHEVVAIAYQSIKVTYQAQLTGGGRGGALTFADELDVTA